MSHQRKKGMAIGEWVLLSGTFLVVFVAAWSLYSREIRNAISWVSAKLAGEEGSRHVAGAISLSKEELEKAEKMGLDEAVSDPKLSNGSAATCGNGESQLPFYTRYKKALEKKDTTNIASYSKSSQQILLGFFQHKYWTYQTKQTVMIYRHWGLRPEGSRCPFAGTSELGPLFSAEPYYDKTEARRKLALPSNAPTLEKNGLHNSDEKSPEFCARNFVDCITAYEVDPDVTLELGLAAPIQDDGTPLTCGTNEGVRFNGGGEVLFIEPIQLAKMLKAQKIRPVSRIPVPGGRGCFLNPTASL